MTERRGVVHVLEKRESAMPPLLYKYGAFTQWTHAIFQNSELYFQSADNFNDPFDSTVRIELEGSKQLRKRFFAEFSRRYDPNLDRRKFLEYQRKFTNFLWDDVFREGMEKTWLKKRAQMGVCCMTENKDNILMWAHYANCHKGFCLEFQTDNPFFSNAHPVGYSTTLPRVNILEQDWDEVTSQHAGGLLTKATEWCYEKEWRIIDLKKGRGPHQFPSEALHGVILGARISATDKQHVVEWCTERAPRPIVYQAYMKEMEYGLDMKTTQY